MANNQLFLVLLIGAALWVGRSWATDYRAALTGEPNERSLPGATPVSAGTIVVASLGALVILAVETGGEHVLGLGAQQSKMTALVGFYSIFGAPMIEEILFRGYLVIEHHGRAALWVGVVGASLLFALAHPSLWAWNVKGLTIHLNGKAWFTTTMMLAASLWLYTVRFFPLNPHRSLLPCFIAHAMKNLGVFGIKYLQGFVGGWW